MVTQLSTDPSLLIHKHRTDQLFPFLLTASDKRSIPIRQEAVRRAISRQLQPSANDHTRDDGTRQRPFAHPESIDYA